MPIKERFTKSERFKIMCSSSKVKLQGKIYSFPWDRTQKEDQIYFVTHLIKKQNAENIIERCRKNGYTLNDFLCAVYCKTYYSYRNELLNIETKYNPFFLTLDFRNYCRPKNNNALFNYSSGLLLQYFFNPNDSIDTIAKEFGKLTVDLKIDLRNFSKNKIPGINTVFLFEVLLKMFPYEMIRKECYKRREMTRCVPGFGNVGNLERIIDQWEGVKVKNSYLTAGLGYCMGAFGLTSSSFYNELTLSTNLYANEKNIEFVKEFFKRFDEVISDMCVVENKTEVYEVNDIKQGNNEGEKIGKH